MLTYNVAVADSLVNGVVGSVTCITHGALPDGQPESIAIKFEDIAGREYHRKHKPTETQGLVSVVFNQFPSH